MKSTQIKPKYIVKYGLINGSYNWVNEDVKIRGSLFTDNGSLDEIDASKLVRSGIRVELLPCTRVERVFHRKKDFEYFYMYSCVLEELRVKLPFTTFECDVLKQFNCVPSQLYPNGWVFVRCFEILMKFLEIKSSLERFLSLFQAKGVWKGVWVNLNSAPGFSIFKLYKSSFKDFKEIFLKVKSVDEDFPFYLDEHLGKNFRCIGTHSHNIYLVQSRLLLGTKCIIEYLVEVVDRGNLISVFDLLP